MAETAIKGLGYVKVQTANISRWRTFAFDILGFAEGQGPDPDALYLRMDERAARLVIVPGDADRVVEVGWEVANHGALQQVSDQLMAASVPFKALTPEEADARRVQEVISFVDPTGTTIEVFHGAVLDHSPVVTPYGARFITGSQGLGHVVLPAVNVQEAFEFYTEVLGFFPRGAFRMPAEPGETPLYFQFMGVNERHHSLALGPTDSKSDPGLVHLMVEVDELDVVGQALDRVLKSDFKLTVTLGRHTNDKMVSFYVAAPGGWEIEFGTGGLVVDQESYSSELITADSYWGHEWLGH